ncbi:MAG: DUF3426 domain-containing protein [Desulfovibrionaceae bacterium]
MLIKCTSCDAKFNLSDSQIRPQIKLRCSVCQHRFPVEDGLLSAEGELLSSREAKKYIDTLMEKEEDTLKKRSELRKVKQKEQKRLNTIISVVILFIIASLGGVYFYTMQNTSGTALIVEQVPNAEQIKELAIKDVRQYYVSNNKKAGPIFVIEGKVQNNFTVPKSLITMSAALLSKEGAIVTNVEQAAGATLSLFQLQMLSKQDIIDSLTDPLEIMTTNANVKPGEEVPFMLLFFDPPKDVSEFSVRIISAQDVDGSAKAK